MAKIRKALRWQLLMSRLLGFLTKETVKMATLQYRVAAFIKCTPFELENKTVFRVRMFESKWKLVAWHAGNCIYWLQMAFLLISYSWAIWTAPFGEGLVLYLVYIVGAMIGWVFITSLLLKPRECFFMLNQHDAIVQTAEEVKVKVPYWSSHYFVILAVYYFSFAILGTWLIAGVMFLWKPKSTYFIYAYLPLNWQESYAVFAAALLHELFWTAWALVTKGAFFCYWCADIFIINDILSIITLKEATTEDHVKLYRYLQIFTILFNDFNGSFFSVGFTTMLVVIPIIFIYVLLTASNLNLLVYLMLPTMSFFCVILIMFFLPQHSKVGILSTDLVKILRSRLIKPMRGVRVSERLHATVADAERRYILKKRIRALPSLGIRIWFFGIHTLDTSQELMNQLFNNILLLLIL